MCMYTADSEHVIRILNTPHKLHKLTQTYVLLSKGLP
jgi:hypothetical protein